MSGINPNYEGCVFCGLEECECPWPDREGHQLGCICADCSGAELTSDND